MITCLEAVCLARYLPKQPVLSFSVLHVAMAMAVSLLAWYHSWHWSSLLSLLNYLFVDGSFVIDSQ